MSKRKGLSLEEKRQVMLNLLMESKGVFTLKVRNRQLIGINESFADESAAQELESLGSKAGVVSNTIKDVVQSLVDDRLVDIERSGWRGALKLPNVQSVASSVHALPVGSGNYYWAFPSKAIVAVRARGEAFEAARAADEAAVVTLEGRLAELSAGRDDAVRRRVTQLRPHIDYPCAFLLPPSLASPLPPSTATGGACSGPPRTRGSAGRAGQQSPRKGPPQGRQGRATLPPACPQRSLEARVKAFAASDPVELASLQAKARTCKAAADRWTDNVWTLVRRRWRQGVGGGGRHNATPAHPLLRRPSCSATLGGSLRRWTPCSASRTRSTTLPSSACGGGASQGVPPDQ